MKRFIFLFTLLLISCGHLRAQQAGISDFRSGKGCFTLDGKPFLVRAAELHYPRIPRPYWEHRIQMCKAMGMNTICIYIFWNLHEQQEGIYDFSGQYDVAAFVRLVQQNGMYCIVRPGPYVCAEWDMGGLPWWLLKKTDIQVRTPDDAYYMQSATRYLREVGRQLAPLQIQNGGSIIMVQVENEYGTWGDNARYMAQIRDILKDSGFNKAQLFRCDWSSNFDRYDVDGVASTLNFGAGSNVDEQFEKFSRLRPDAPRMCSEYWTGWFDQWGRPHETRGVETFIGSLRDMLTRGISFSLYMAHGGTSFGPWAGANAPPYAPTVTSYDYDAPINESGEPTEKFYAIRNLLKNYLNPGEVIPEIPVPVTGRVTLPEIIFKKHASLFDNLPAPVYSQMPKPMEFFNQGWGSILYSKTLIGSNLERRLTIDEVHDYALVYYNRALVGIIDRRLGESSIILPANTKGGRLDILVEATGRVNYGKAIIDRKGINGRVLLESANGMEEVNGWDVIPLPLDLAAAAPPRYRAKDVTGPGWHTADFVLNKTGDTYLDMRGWSKGSVWVNGHNLERFWSIGPTQTLYVPGCWLTKGKNTITVYDIQSHGMPKVSSAVKPIYEIVANNSLLHNRKGEIPDFSKVVPVVHGSLDDTPGWKEIPFTPVKARYICFEAISSQNASDLSASLAELGVVSTEGEIIEPQKWSVLYADSEEVTLSASSADKVFDQQESIAWQTSKIQEAKYPYKIIIDMGESLLIKALRALPRTDGKKEGLIREFNFYAQANPFTFIKK